MLAGAPSIRSTDKSVKLIHLRCINRHRVHPDGPTQPHERDTCIKCINEDPTPSKRRPVAKYGYGASDFANPKLRDYPACTGGILCNRPPSRIPAFGCVPHRFPSNTSAVAAGPPGNCRSAEGGPDEQRPSGGLPVGVPLLAHSPLPVRRSSRCPRKRCHQMSRSTQGACVDPPPPSR